ncbi:hypothetical protein GW17_00002172 [Ensete ventricosum]|nr:hypothetical protein GW17_00002172 [Ensete ventricosum]
MRIMHIIADLASEVAHRCRAYMAPPCSIVSRSKRGSRISQAKSFRHLEKMKRTLCSEAFPYKLLYEGGERSLPFLKLFLLLFGPPCLDHPRSCILSHVCPIRSTASGFSSTPSSSLVPPPQAGGCRSSGSESGWFEPCSSSSGIMTRIDIKAFQALEVMKSCHDFDSTLTVESLVMVRKRYSILDEYVLHAPFPGQCPYDAYPEGFNISVDALEVVLKFSVHPMVGECLIAEMVNLDLIRSATKTEGHPGSASRAPAPTAPIVQLSSDIEEVKVKVVAKEGVGALGKHHVIGGAHPRKKIKVSDRHKSQREGEGSKSRRSKGKEQVGPIGETQAPRPRHPRSVTELCQTSDD